MLRSLNRSQRAFLSHGTDHLETRFEANVNKREALDYLESLYQTKFNLGGVLPYSFLLQTQIAVFYVMYQTRETVFHRDIQTPRRELKIRPAARYF